MIDGLTLARAIHVVAIVHWIGGVSAVTTIVLPEARRLSAPAAVEAFESFERRFATQARVSIFLVGLSGIYMLHKLNAWDRFADARFWWLHLMLIVWLIFAIMVYLVEPLFMHDRFRRMALANPERAFALATRFHGLALVATALVIAAGVLGAHGALPRAPTLDRPYWVHEPKQLRQRQH